MSTILKALRRLEDDRAANGERPLRESVAAGGGSEARGTGRGFRWLVVLALLAGAGVGAGLLAFWSVGEPEPTRLAAAPEVPPARSASDGTDDSAVDRLTLRGEPDAVVPLEPSFDELVQMADDAALPDAALTSRVERIDRPVAGPRIDDDPLEPNEPTAVVSTESTQLLVRGEPLVPPERLPGRHAPAPPPAPVAVVAVPKAPARAPEAPPEREAPPPKRDPAPTATRRQPVQTESRVVATQPPPEPPPREPGPTRVARDTPPPPAPAREADERPSVANVTPAEPVAKPSPAPKPVVPAPAPRTPETVARAEVPDVTIASTSWHPVAARRTATLQLGEDDPVEVHEGDAVGPLVVARIEPSTVVFVHEGIEVRRKVGER